MPLAEGKNIHFSPVDNKPLCSYSSKLCRQRRLNGYGFCIRHILEDKSAPFKQCDFVTRNNSQKCLNAIPTNQERGYCHSHMQVAGIIPKTERKVKPSTTSCSKPSVKSTGDSVTSTSESSGTKSSKSLPNETKQTKAIPKGKSNTSSSLAPGAINAVISINSNGSSEHPLTNGFLKPHQEDPLKKKSKSTGKKNEAQVKGSTTDKPSPKPKKKQNKGAECPKFPSSTSTAFEQLKTLKILEKLPLRTGGEQVPVKPSLSIEETLEISLVPPFLKKSISSDTVSNLDENENKPNSSESRQEFLNRVRSSYKTQYKVLRRVVKTNEKNEVKVNEALRESLLSCVVIDASRCAHILVNGEDEVEVESKGKKSSKANGLINGKRKEKTTVSPLGHVTASQQGNQSSLDNASTDKATKPKKTKSKKLVKTEAVGTQITQQNKIEIKIEEGQSDDGFLDPWLNGHLVKTLEIKKPTPKKSKAKPCIKVEGDCKTEVKKSPPVRKQAANGCVMTNGASSSNIIVLPTLKKSKRQSATVRKSSVLAQDGQFHSHSSAVHENSEFLDSIYPDPSFAAKKRRIDLSESASTIMSNGVTHRHHILDPNITLNATAAFHTAYSPSHLSAVAQLENVLNSVSSSETATTPDGVITDASFDSPFDHSTSSHPDCDFPDDVDDLEKSFELHIDAEIAHQASRLIEENGFTEEDFSELFPDNRLSDHKLGTDLGLDFTSSNFEPADIDYAIFSNIFRPPGSNESISVTQNF